MTSQAFLGFLPPLPLCLFGIILEGCRRSEGRWVLWARWEHPLWDERTSLVLLTPVWLHPPCFDGEDDDDGCDGHISGLSACIFQLSLLMLFSASSWLHAVVVSV